MPKIIQLLQKCKSRKLPTRFSTYYALLLGSSHNHRRVHGLRTPNETFFHRNPKLLGLSKYFQVLFLDTQYNKVALCRRKGILTGFFQRNLSFIIIVLQKHLLYSYCRVFIYSLSELVNIFKAAKKVQR